MAMVMNGGVGSWQCGKGRVLTTFPQVLLLFSWRKFTEKSTMERGEGSANASHLPVDALLKVLSSINLTIHKE